MERSAQVRIPATARRGEAIRVRCMLMHPMENGYRMDAHGTMVPVDLVHAFSCRYNGVEVFRAELGIGVAANPYLNFPLVAEQSGTIELQWLADDGSVHARQAHIEVT